MPRKSKDRLTQERRSWNMSRIRGKNTTPEIVVRKLLHRLGYRFRLHVRIPIPDPDSNSHTRKRAKSLAEGRSLNRRAPRDAEKKSLKSEPSTRPRRVRFVCPDIVLPKYKTVIFVHGCFWHRHRGCKNCTTPTNRREWWLKKLEGNAARDKVHRQELRKEGWRSIIIWECLIKSQAGVEQAQRRLIARLEQTYFLKRSNSFGKRASNSSALIP